MAKFDVKAAIKKAAKTGPDMNVAQAGGGYTPPAAGTCGLRFVSYMELGKHKGEWEGKPKITDEVQLVFELSGPKWEPTVLDSGEKVPQRLTVTMAKFLSAKASFFKLFKAMNHEGKATIMAELLGESFIGTVYHHKYKRKDGSEAIKVNFKDPNSGALTIRAPFVEDIDTGEVRKRNIPPPLTEIKCFLWDDATKEMWDDIYIDGEYPEKKDEKTGEVTHPARSKNRFQNRIKEAMNFVGSPIHAALEGAGELELDVDDVKKVKKDGKKKDKEGKKEKRTAETDDEPSESAEDTDDSTPPFDMDDDPLAALG